MAKSKGKRGKPPMADLADRHALYERSVQSVEDEVDFLRDTYRSVRGRPALSLREDFCGTAAAACEWVRVDDRHTAIGIDIDGSVLGWGREQHVSKLDADAKMRLKLIQGDVMTADVYPVDLLIAFNFSYWTFKTRDKLRSYFERAREGLNSDGVMIVDAFGGSEAHDEMEEETEHDGFTYVWDQDHFDPITHDFRCYIHFKFPDGSKMKRAFSYSWRLWSLPEIRELMLEAGFSKVTVYWDKSEDDDDDEYEPAEHGRADPAWIAYVVAEK